MQNLERISLNREDTCTCTYIEVCMYIAFDTIIIIYSNIVKYLSFFLLFSVLNYDVCHLYAHDIDFS